MSIIKSSFYVTALSLTTSLISFVNQILLAKYFGASKSMDIYIYASSFPLLISALVTSSLSYMVVPFIIKIQDEKNSKVVIGEFIKRVFKISGILNFTLMIISISIFYFINKEINYELIWINLFTWITSFFSIILAFFNNVLNANKKFVKALWIAIVPYIATIIFTLLLHSILESISISIGLLVGTILSTIISWISIKKYVILNNNSNAEHKKLISSFLTKLPIVSLSMLCFSAYQFIDTFWAPRVGNSVLSYLSYSQKLIIAVGAIIITGPSTVLIPRLTVAHNEGRIKDYLNDVLVALKLIVCLASFFTILIGLLSEHIIKVMFQRGKFTLTDTIEIASVLPYMLLGMIFMLCVVLIFRANFASGFNRTTVLLGITSSLLYFVFSGVGSTYIGIKGIAIAYILTWFIILILSLRNIFKGNLSVLFHKEIVLDFFKIIILNILVFTSLIYTKEYLYIFFPINSFLSEVFFIGILSTINGFVFFVLAIYIIKQKDMILLYNKLLKK